MRALVHGAVGNSAAFQRSMLENSHFRFILACGFSQEILKKTTPITTFPLGIQSARPAYTIRSTIAHKSMTSGSRSALKRSVAVILATYDTKQLSPSPPTESTHTAEENPGAKILQHALEKKRQHP